MFTYKSKTNNSVWQDGKYILIYVSIHTHTETHAIVIAKPYLDLMG